jgi:polysaccharide biosynthesis transport protein
MMNRPQRELPQEMYFEPESEGEFHLSQWLEVVQRRRWLLVAVAGLVIALAMVHFAITPNAYRATTVVQIERRTPSYVSAESMWSAEAYYDAQSFYPTQYRLLQSRGLAERVVRMLRLDEDSAFNPARASLRSENPEAITAAEDATALARLARRLVGGLEVNPVRNTRLVEISYRSHSPVLAARIANAFADAYIDWGVESRFDNVGRASSFLASQIETLKREIQDKEMQLQAYGRRADIVTLEPGSNVTLQRPAALNQDFTAAVSDRINKEARYQHLVNSPKEAVADPLSGGLVGQLRSELIKMERDYATRLGTFRPEWPAMLELNAQIERSRQNLASVIDETVEQAREAARSEYQTALRREQSLRAELARQTEEMRQLNSAAVEYNNLQLEISSRRTLLDDLTRKQTETGVASRLEGTASSNVVVVDRALVPGGAFRPSLRRNLALGLLLGFGLGLGSVFLVEYLDRTLKTPEDVDRVLGLPVLTVVPDMEGGGSAYGAYAGYGYGVSSRRKKAKTQIKNPPAGKDDGQAIELLPASHPRLAVSEAYRSLRTALLLSTPDGLRSVLVSSAVTGEGKSTTASNLAVVLAQLGRKVLIVDGDLRKPRLHQIFSVSNRAGLVSFLTGSAEAPDVFLQTKIPNLWVAPSGPTPPNPSELLSSNRMKDFLELAGQHFDHVVVDSTPTLPVTDAAIVGTLVDGTVLCIGANQVLREDAVACRDRLALAGCRVLGVVLNRFRVPSSRYGKAYRRYQSAYEAYQDADLSPSEAGRS